MVEYLAYGIATTPVGWWFIFRSPWNPAKKGSDIHSLPTIKCGELNSAQVGIGDSIIKRLDQVNHIRRGNAGALRDILSAHDFITLPNVPEGAVPVFLRFPVIVDDKNRANNLYLRLSEAGIGVSRSYTSILPDLFQDTSFIKTNSFKGAQRLSECLLTLPTHAYVGAEDLLKIKRIFESVRMQ